MTDEFRIIENVDGNFELKRRWVSWLPIWFPVSWEGGWLFPIAKASSPFRRPTLQEGQQTIERILRQEEKKRKRKRRVVYSTHQTYN
jgi:hypothetical protein